MGLNPEMGNIPNVIHFEPYIEDEESDSDSEGGLFIDEQNIDDFDSDYESGSDWGEQFVDGLDEELLQEDGAENFNQDPDEGFGDELT